MVSENNTPQSQGSGTIKANQPPPTPGGKGRIWKTGIHRVWVNNKPARVFTPQYTIQETYETWNGELERNGGIPLGIDHIPEELKAQYPILQKLYFNPKMV